MPKVNRGILSLGLAGITLAGCSKHGASSVDPMNTPTFVEVQNQGFYDMTIYVIRSGQRIRIGQVGGNSTATLELPRTVVSPGLPLQFMADPIGGNRTPVSEEIRVNPGDTVVLRIPPY